MALSVRPLSLSCLPGNESQLVHRLAFVTECPLKAISFHISLRTDARRESHQVNDQMNGSQVTGTQRCCRASLRHVPCDALEASAPHRAREYPGHPAEGLCERAWLDVADASRYLSYGEVSVGEQLHRTLHADALDEGCGRASVPLPEQRLELGSPHAG